MHHSPFRPLVGLLALGFLASGCSGSAPALETQRDAPEASRSDIESLYWQRIAENKTYSEADVAYMTGMIGHHAQALILADMAYRNAASGSIKTLAARIENAQKDEIESMQRWLRDRGQPVPVPTFEGTLLTVTMEAPEASGEMDHSAMDHQASGEMEHSGMDHSTMDHSGMDHGAMGHGGMDHSGMPGMLSQAQLDEMNAAKGRAFDVLFLRYMIQHHAGAVTMTDDLFTKDGAAQDDTAFKIASDIQVDQRTEIARMQLMLDRLSD
ncbi:DUF305 domain-containing protein [Rubricoccus marinus]|uniref:DUF305 domain-containing protein n=1 Tax=Rubricoccus marinus TaxID=716817 RepID=A0A259TY82_9BACT|nr:DUF305 domain-containing protein [Rubricoccus marinus]OZC02709.1 hypothetical protein BSZ36_06805 [Rubricoccus marinus]